MNRFKTHENDVARYHVHKLPGSDIICSLFQTQARTLIKHAPDMNHRIPLRHPTTKEIHLCETIARTIYEDMKGICDDSASSHYIRESQPGQVEAFRERLHQTQMFSVYRGALGMSNQLDDSLLLEDSLEYSVGSDN